MADTQIDKAVVTLAAKEVVDKFNKQMESILKLEVSDIMPLVDSIRTQFGPELAENFANACTSMFSEIKQNLVDAKLALGSEVDKLEKIVDGSSDMSDYVPTEAPDQDTTETAQEQGGDAEVSQDTDTDSVGDQTTTDDAGDDLMKPSIGRDPKMIESLMKSGDSDTFIMEKIKDRISSGSAAIDAIKFISESLDIDMASVVEVVEAHLSKKKV